MNEDPTYNSIVKDVYALSESETDYLELCLDLIEKKETHEKCKDIISQEQAKL